MRIPFAMVLSMSLASAACGNAVEGSPSNDLTSEALSQTVQALKVEVSPSNLVEEIYAFRTTRDSRVQPPTAFCSNVGFTAFAEDQFTAWTYRERIYDGRVANPQLYPIGSFHGCVGSTANPDVSNFYMIGSIGDLPETTLRGTCTFLKRNVPETGVSALTCVLDPTAEGYIGGQAITNTMSAPATTTAYQTPSFVHLRLWRPATDREIRHAAD